MGNLYIIWGSELMERKPHIRITLKHNYQKILVIEISKAISE